MGRGHGSSRGGGGASGFRGDASMEGYSAGLAKAVSGREAEIRNGDTEKLSIFDSTGKEVYRNDKGEKHSVTYDGSKAKDNILTHNHPSGSSFSTDDVMGAVRNDVAEIRAVGSNRTYSLKRPKGGWGISEREAWRIHASELMKQGARSERYIENYKGDKSVAKRRADAVFSHAANKRFAKRTGLIYSVTKTK